MDSGVTFCDTPPDMHNKAKSGGKVTSLSQESFIGAFNY